MANPFSGRCCENGSVWNQPKQWYPSLLVRMQPKIRRSRVSRRPDLSTCAIGSGSGSFQAQPMGQFAYRRAGRFVGAMQIIKYRESFEVRSDDGQTAKQFPFDDNARRRAISGTMKPKQALHSSRPSAAWPRPLDCGSAFPISFHGLPERLSNGAGCQPAGAVPAAIDQRRRRRGRA
jgi:hypothetical protein